MSEPLTSSDDLLRLDGITVRLSGREVLHDVSFTIRPGRITGLIGPNGAGKTTILRVILGLLPPSAGTVTVAGQAIGSHRHGGLLGLGGVAARLGDRLRAAEAADRAGHAAAGPERGRPRHRREPAGRAVPVPGPA